MIPYNLECWHMVANETEDFDNFVVDAETLKDAVFAVNPRRFFLIDVYLVSYESSYFKKELNIVRGQKKKRVDFNSEWVIKDNCLLN